MAPVEIRDLHKRFGSVNAVNGLSFDVEPGRVTGFLGPNGAGKSTTLRALLGLIRPTAGTATFGGHRYDELDRPSKQVGAVLEDASFHPGRTARNHLRVLAVTGEHPAGRVDEVLSAVGLDDAADRRVKGYSMGMRQRLAIAAALLGDPEVLILDEPTNGLDPPGISWMRGLLRQQAASGRAVLVSSHLLAEVAQSVDDVVIIANGELRGRGTLEQVLGGDDGPATEVRSQDPERLASALEQRGHRVERERAEGFVARLEGCAGSARPVESARLASARAHLARARDAADPELDAAAVDAWLVVSRPYPVALAQLRRAETLVSRGEREAAAAQLIEVLAAASALDASWLRAEAEGLATRARLPLPSIAAPPAAAGPDDDTDGGDPFGLTPRERQVIALVANGATNREIGAQLYMAEKTASVHVSRILAKLDVRSRTEAAAVAHRLGLGGTTSR